MARLIRTIDLNIFPVDKTIFGLLKEEQTRYKNIKTEIESWGVKFPSVKMGVVFIMAMPNMSYDTYLTQFNKYNLESNYIKGANADALKEISELFKENSADSELIKLLKEIANDEEQKALLEASFEDTSGGVLWVVFLLETFKNFYLNYLPQHINEKLTIDPVITLGEVKEKLKPVLSDTFATLYSSFLKVEQESDLEQLKTDTNNNLEKIKKVIYDARDSKKPVEPEKPDQLPQDNTEQTDLKNELAELYAYLDGVLDKQAQLPVYILTEEPEQMKREGSKTNPNYLIFEEELLKHPIIKDKVEERINKRKFSTPIAINKDKPAKPDDRPNITQQDYQNLLNNQEKHKPEDLEKHRPEELKPADYDTNISKLNEWQTTFPNLKPSEIKGQLESKPADQQPQPTPEQISKASQYDQFASLFPDGKVPSNIKELWQSLNDRPNISQSDYNNLLQQAQQAGVKPEELKLLLKDNWDYLKGHIDILTNIIKRAVPTSTPDLSGGSSSNQTQKPDSTTTSESKPKGSEQAEKPDQISQ